MPTPDDSGSEWIGAAVLLLVWILLGIAVWREENKDRD